MPRKKPSPRKKAAAKAQPSTAEVATGPAAPVSAAVVTWEKDSPASREAAYRAFAAAITSADQPQKERAAASNVWFNVHSPNTSVRDGYDRTDYEAFREEGAMPRSPREAMRQAMLAYEEHGIVRNVIDLMTDFAVKGIDLEHPSPAAETFLKEWFRRVDGFERSAAFLKQLFLCNNVVVRRHTGKLSKPNQKKWKRTAASDEPGGVGGSPATAEADTHYEPDPAPAAREIPLRYSFLNPLSVDVADEQLATFVGPPFKLHMTVPPTVVNRVKNPRTPADREFVAALPQDLAARIRKDGGKIALDPDKVSCFYYKRDDWCAWATPFLRSVLPDLQILQKMKLADLSALDGAISNIRIWRLGSLEHQIYPPAEVIQHLAEMLTSNVGGGVMDLVWGPDIDLLETSTEVHRFLGETKYAPVLNAIFQGLGIPATLNGTGQRNNTGYTNNYMSMRTFAERLEYARVILRMFWEGELRRVQRAMGHAKPAALTFDGLLTDDANLVKLYLDMADRGLVSEESLQEFMDLNPEIEHVRLRKEKHARDNKRLPAKAGPFHDAMTEEGLWKILAQTGQYGPSELGLQGREKEEGEEPPAERGAKLAKKYAPPPAPVGGKPGASKPKGQPGQGRPQGKKDSAKRKQKAVKPRTKAPPRAAAFMADLATAQAQLAEVGRLVSPLYLQAVGKKTARELTVGEAAELEDLRFAVLCQYPLRETPTAASVREKIEGPLEVPAAAALLFQATLREHAASNGQAPTAEAARTYMAGVHAVVRGAD